MTKSGLANFAAVLFLTANASAATIVCRDGFTIEEAAKRLNAAMEMHAASTVSAPTIHHVRRERSEGSPLMSEHLSGLRRKDPANPFARGPEPTYEGRLAELEKTSTFVLCVTTHPIPR